MKKFLAFFSGMLPTSVWEKMEYTGAYFAGKGSGSDSLGAEAKAAARFIGDRSGLVIFDIGANQGDWSAAILGALGRRIAKLYQWEPSPHNIQFLRERFSDERISVVPFAVGDREGDADLFSDTPGSGMASLYKRELTHANISLDKSSKVKLTTLDTFITEHKIKRIDFMKMDIEGGEFAALRGATHALENGTIAALSFEFGGCNIDSRTYFQDYWYLLSPLGYEIFRVLPNSGTRRVHNYSEMLECFRTTNYVAVRPSSAR